MAVNQTRAFGALDHSEAWLGRVNDLGLVGIFLVAAVANSSLLIQVPYTLPLLTVALSGASFIGMLPATLACGIGAGTGEVISYALAEKLLGRNPELQRSPLFRWVTRTVERHPRLTPAIVFAWAGSILPDDTVVIPLAMMRYGLRRICLPLFAGKLLHATVVAFVFYAFTSWASRHASAALRTDMALAVVIVFLLLILYQAEKARNAGRRTSTAEAESVASVATLPETGI